MNTRLKKFPQKSHAEREKDITEEELVPQNTFYKFLSTLRAILEGLPKGRHDLLERLGHSYIGMLSE